jgi:CRISPR/Cas system-associated exonuclease Cas4 (RecB family)
MRDEFRASRDGAYRRRKALGLVEHEYAMEIADAEWKRNWEHAERCLRAFYEAPIREEILATPPERWLPIDDMASFFFEGTKVYVAPDFAFRDAEGRLRILDWKTGRRREKDREQVRGYALFAAHTWDAHPEEIRGELHYLAEGTVDTVDVDPRAIEAFVDRMRASIAEMKAALADPERNLAEEASFPPVSEARVCRWCNFRRLCDGARLE